MTTTEAPSAHRRHEGFSHEALFYVGDDDFLDATLAFIREGLAGDEAMLVVVSAAKIARLKAELGPDAGRVGFGDMDAIGTNPARIIPAWRDFVDEHGVDGRSFRGIGEPIWAGRTPAELAECQRHESLLNLAFADSGSWRLLCPYDTVALDDDVIAEAMRSHATLVDGDDERVSPDFVGLDAIAAPFDWPLPDPPPHAVSMVFDLGPLHTVREFVARHATDAGLSAGRVADLVVAVNELATNSLRHGGGQGLLRTWLDDDSVICEISDDGRIEDPLVGRERRSMDSVGGRGLWIANQLCELVQVRTFETGSVVRVHMRRS